MRRKDQVAFIMLKRTNGSDGTISCLVNTESNEEVVMGKKAAIPRKDFEPIKDRRI